jgi:uncharacterized membrane protein YvbJ
MVSTTPSIHFCSRQTDIIQQSDIVNPGRDNGGKNMADQEMKTCPACGRQIRAGYITCPFCGKSISDSSPKKYATYPAVSVPVGEMLTFFLYLISLFISPYGILIGVLWLGLGSDYEKQRIGKNCLILGIIGIVIGILILLAIFSLTSFPTTGA